METYKVWVMGADGQCVQIDMPLIESKIVYRPNTGLKNEEPQNIEVGYKFAEVTRIFNDHWICILRRRHQTICTPAKGQRNTWSYCSLHL